MVLSWRSALNLSAVLLAAGLAAACSPAGVPEIAFGIDGCASCGMVVDSDREAAAFVLEREIQVFCSAGCLLSSFEERRKAGKPLPREVYFSDYQGGGLYPPESLAFLLTDQLPTVMGWGILALEDTAAAEALKLGQGDMVTDWMGVRRLRGAPDRRLSVGFIGGGMSPEVVEMERDELVVLEMRATEQGQDLTIRIRGYEELGDVLLPASGEVREVRLLAVRPGDGFPVVRLADGSTLGRIRVTGAHTAAEEPL